MEFASFKNNNIYASKNTGLLGSDKLIIRNGGSIWVFKNIDSLLFCEFSKDNGKTFSYNNTISSNYDGLFSFSTIDKNILYFVFKDTFNNIVLCKWEDEEFHIEELDIKLMTGDKPVYQCIMTDNNRNIHIIIFVENPIKQTWQIQYCCKKGPNRSTLETVERGSGNIMNHGATALEQNGTIHLVYQIRIDYKYLLIYCRKALSDNWSTKTVITETGKKNLCPCLAIDAKEIVHLTWMRSDGINYRIIYKRKTKGGWFKGGWQKDQYLSLPDLNSYCPAINLSMDKIMISWQQIDRLCSRTSWNGGSSFEEAIIIKDCPELFEINEPTKPLTDAENKLFDTSELQITANNIPIPSDTIAKILRNVVFESADTYLTNMQMRETLEENNYLIKELNLKLTDINYKLHEAKKNIIILENALRMLRENYHTFSINNKKAQDQLEQKILTLEENNSMLTEKLKDFQTINDILKRQSEEKDMLITGLLSDIESLRSDLERFEKIIFWKKKKSRKTDE